jgi:predicted dehydrogenase/threonine dehydrogenase-like Zn-dependent dehydrogenase
MKQVLLKRGQVIVAEVPQPSISANQVLVEVAYSCISPGTETSALQSHQSILSQILKKPETIQRGLEMLVDKGLQHTLDLVKGTNLLPSQIGYSAAGTVKEVGAAVHRIAVGQRVAVAGTGYANHAALVSVPANLVACIPSNDVSYKDASSVALGSIALHAVRRANLQLGEYCVVFGLGALGQLAVQLAQLAGARVIAIDREESRVALASELGAELSLNVLQTDIQRGVTLLTGGKGADAVIFAASTDKPEVLSQAFQLCRRKGRLVMLGVYGAQVDRNDLYPKEIDFLISTSYGPGRYDSNYEEAGVDYPYDYVRWTLGRNMEEYLRLLSTRSVDVSRLIEQEFDVTEADNAFQALTAPNQRPLLVVLKYPTAQAGQVRITVHNTTPTNTEGKVALGIIGAGSFVRDVHLPNLCSLADRVKVVGVCNRTGVSASAVASRLGADFFTSDYQEIINEPSVQAVLIGTRHDLHAELTLEALKRGKHVLVEKPLCLNLDQLNSIEEFYKNDEQQKPMLMVGYNRRFSPYSLEVARLIANRKSPLFMRYRVNAGLLPDSHWVYSQEGGGRIVGEACHFIDLLQYFSGSLVRTVSTSHLAPISGPFRSDDNVIITMEFEDGSVGSIEYLTCGSPTLSKELVEIHFDQKMLIIDNFQKVSGIGVGTKVPNSKQPRKGHREMLAKFIENCSKTDGDFDRNLNCLLNVSKVAILSQFTSLGAHDERFSL